ncbi:aldo/keto reductase family protein [Mycobacterium xenopi 4042]|uniref:Aldo/keto reductase family protein n=1 Tax=Mycobacterium xenopi 4042 TaxID=1299334 RepID=X8DAP4_MYCXE|nr:aldo/keto reductase family protein [Mycobacterium xenopi 4042]
MKYLDVDGIGKVSRIGLGTWQFGSLEWGYGDRYASGAARDIVRRALDLGVTLFDTAEIYGLGKSERILGEALGDRRAEVVVASKIMPIAPFPAVVKQRERASARRLRLDRIPLYQIHQPNPVFPDSVIMPGMRDLLDSGAIGAAGFRTIRCPVGRRPTLRSGARLSATRCIFRSRILRHSTTSFRSRSARTAS